MSRDLSITIPRRHPSGQSRQALKFFVTASLVVLASGLILALLASLFGRPVHTDQFWFPPAFAVTSALLVAGSVALQRAIGFVRREQQRPFRSWLATGLACGTLFLGIQMYGLWTLLPGERVAADAALGVTPFVLMLAALHAVHLSVAVLFLVFVLLQALADRYDHEYYWGVRVCACFWHGLGVVWLFILAIFGIAL